MTDLITDEAVEEAAKAGFAASAVNAAQEYELDQPVTWDGHLTDRDRAHERLRARAALEAAGPLIAAKALEAVLAFATTERDKINRTYVLQPDTAYAGYANAMDDVIRTIEAATEGPWEADGTEISQHWSRPEPWKSVASNEVACMAYCYGGSGRGIEREDDARFIADARTSLPRALKALEAALAKAQAYVDEYGDPVYSGNGYAEGIAAASREIAATIESALRADS